MSRSFAGDRAAGAGALLTLVTLLVLPPLALTIFVGWPLPTSLPGATELGEALRSGVEDTVVVKALALVAWLAWSQVAVTIVVEAVAVVRGGVARRLPVFGGVQVGVARLVATALLLVAAAGPTKAAATPALAPIVADPVADLQGEPALHHPPLPPTVKAPTPVPSELPRYEVRRHDTLWSIAEKTLGDGLRWHEIIHLNVNGAAADSHALGLDGGHIEPGWVLTLPAGADTSNTGLVTSTGAAVPNVPAPPPASLVVERGEHLWSIAEGVLGRALGHSPTTEEMQPYWQRLVDANRGRLVRSDDPDLLFAGQELVVPPVEGAPAAPSTPPVESGPAPPVAVEPALPAPPAPPAPTASEPGSEVRDPVDALAPQTGAPTGPDRGRAVATDDADADESGVEVVVPGMLGVAAAGLAVGLAHAVRRRRRQRLMHLTPGVEPPLPDPALDELRAAIVLSSDEDRFDLLDRRLRALAAAVLLGGDAVRPRVVQSSDDAVEVLLSSPAPAPEGWRSEAGGSVWVSEGSEPVVGVVGGAPSPVLVSLGPRGDSGQLYLDLEAEHVLLVTGDEPAACGFVRAIVLELAHSSLASGASILVVGDIGGPSLDHLDRTTVVAQWDEAADHVSAWATQSRNVLDANGWPDGFHGRASTTPTDGLAPLVVVCAQVPTDTSFVAVCGLVRTGATTVTLVVIGDELAGATCLELSGDQLRIPALDLVCRAQSLDEGAVEQVVQLLADAEQLPDPPPFEPEDDEVTGPLPSPVEDDEEQRDGDLAPDVGGRYVDPPHDIRVRLLGDIEVVGGVRPLTPKQTAVVAYIGVHPSVSAERVEDAVWTTPTASRRKRLANTLSECRASLGATQLPATADGRYRLGPAVRTDLELFDRRVALAAGQPAEVAIELLRGAIELVHGPPFAYRTADSSSYVWVDLENWHTTWELQVTAAAAELADLYLGEGETDEAIWAAQQGLLASPTDTRLTEALMRAYAARGDRLSAERVYQNHVASLEKLEIDDVAESTVNLRERLRNGED